MTRFIETEESFDGIFSITKNIIGDNRGYLERLFCHHELKSWEKRPISQVNTTFTQKKGSVRGLHFQRPPMDHIKMVYCVQGQVMDVVVDLRVGSPTYGQHAVFELSAVKGSCIYIPKGTAHGFCALSENTVMVYKVSTVYSPEYDAGILSDSLGIAWPTNEPIMSARDRSFPTFTQFESPFQL